MGRLILPLVSMLTQSLASGEASGGQRLHLGARHRLLPRQLLGDGLEVLGPLVWLFHVPGRTYSKEMVGRRKKEIRSKERGRDNETRGKEDERQRRKERWNNGWTEERKEGGEDQRGRG